MNKFTIKDVAINSLLASSYFVLVFVFSFLSFETIQFRIAEILLVLVLINPKYSIGLIIGTLLANLQFSPFGIIDALVGSLASLLSIIMMITLRKKPLIALIFPALFNGLLVGTMIYIISSYQGIYLYLFSFFLVFIGEFITLYLLGYPLYKVVNKRLCDL